MRRKTLEKLMAVDIKQLSKKNAPVSSYFGENVFNVPKMERYVSRKTISAFNNWISNGVKINQQAADEIAEAMKIWAISMGATHYTHWFQPMTGMTAEKHDSFIKINSPGQVIEEFSGNKLIAGEPDASSFPSGGIRSTFEARGYTAWDPSSPAIIVETATGKTLTIPTIFISYTGEALDKKLPLLRSDEAVSEAAKRLLKVFGKNVHKVISTCGPEQEYFLIDRSYFNLRQDLLLTNRTLIGAASPKGQQLEDQYFGSIKERIFNYMNAVEEEAYKYGIPLTTRHNEVAPSQYEFAPIFEESNLAADHNQLLMNIMKKVAAKFGLACLLHEKPFAGVNGSGKHLNWSLSDDHGNNLLNPGDTPEENLQFLTVLVAVLSAVHNHSDLLYASIVSSGNEHRLGANEAPPAIISVFLGDYLSNLLDEIEAGKKSGTSKKDVVDFKIGRLPEFIKDTTDRNRTSPFAFTGAKFEFRAVGSSHNISTPITVINTIIAEALDNVAEAITKAANAKKATFETAVLSVLRKIITETKPIRFEGNNYSKDWVAEAAKRGLGNEPSAVRALKTLVKPSTIALFKKYRVFNESEIKARYHIWVEMYCTQLGIEANTLIEMADSNVIPDAFEYQKLLLTNLNLIQDSKGLNPDKKVVADLQFHVNDVSNKIFFVRKNVGALTELIKDIGSLDAEEKAERIFAEMKPILGHIRRHIDELEQVVPDKYWSLPKYREMLFLV